MALAMLAAEWPYTVLRTDVISAKTRWLTHPPDSTKTSAADACFGSSPVMRRTRTLVSTARMPLSHVSADAFFELGERAPLRRAVREKDPADIVEGVDLARRDDGSFELRIILTPRRHRLSP